MNKALLHNFPQKLTPYKIDITEDPNAMVDCRKTIDCILVDMYLPPSGPVVAELRSDVLSALILHDELCMNINDVIHLLNLFGTNNCIKLLEANAFEFYDDLGPVTGAIMNDANTYKLVNANIYNKDGKLAEIEKSLKRISTLPRNDINAEQIKHILTLLVSNTLTTEKEFIRDLLFKETAYDVRNKNITDLFKISSTDFEAINKNDLPNILRLNHINRGLIDAQRIGADSIIIDNWAKVFIRGKLSPAMNEYALHAPVDIFKMTILSNKGIPDLNLLFENEIIDADDIIRFRENMDGKLFRKWLSDIDYNPEEILATLLNKKHPSLANSVVKHIRFIYPKVMSLINPLAGFAASYFDSYIVQKILKGWHPSLFLDDKFKFTIDKNIELSKKQNKLDQLQKINDC